MIIVKKEVTPILSDILHELINVAEQEGHLMNARTFTMFMSHSRKYLQKNQKLYDRLAEIIEFQLNKGLNNLRMEGEIVDPDFNGIAI